MIHETTDAGAAQPARQAGHVSGWASRWHIHSIRRGSNDRSRDRIARWTIRFMHNAG